MYFWPGQFNSPGRRSAVSIGSASAPRIVRRAGFTQIELLVTIGIIVVLLSILLPVIHKVQIRGRELQCQSNIREILQVIGGYVAENRGNYPYGFQWARTRVPMGTHAADWDQAPGNDGEFISWPSQIGKWLNRGKVNSVENDAYNFPSVLRCPEAMQVRDHFVSYAMNMIVAVDPRVELQVGRFPNAQTRPPNTSLLTRAKTALIWDTAVFIKSPYDLDFLIGLDIDNQRFWQGAAIPQYRYYRADSDPFGHIGSGVFGQNMPVKLDVGNAVYRNIDPIDPSVGAPYQGNLRFRHRGDTSCNVGFVDGHVEAFTAVVNSDKTVASHNVLRKYFMIKWPTGVSPDPSTPY